MRNHQRAICLGLLIAAALLVRIAAVLVLQAYQEPYLYEHGEIASNLVQGRGFTVHFLGVEGPTSQQAPVIPYVLAAAYWIWGVNSPSALLAFQLLQCLIGAAVVPCVAMLGWRLVPQMPGVGWFAAVLAAFHPVHIYLVTHVQVVVWATLGLTALVTLVIYLRSSADANLAGAACAGLLAGLLLLIEPIYAVVLPMLACALWIRVGERPTLAGLRPVAVMTGVALLTVMPWLVRNYRVHGECVFVKSTFGYAFWQGNHPASWGTDKIPKPSALDMLTDHDGSWAGQHRAMAEARSETLYIDDVLLKPHGYARFQHLSEPQRSRLLGQEVWPHLTAHPDRYLKLCWQRLNFFWLCDKTNPKTYHPLYRLSAWLGCWMAVAGLVVSWSQRKQWWPVYATLLLVTGFHAMTIVSARFRVPLEPLSFVAIALLLAAAAKIIQQATPLACGARMAKPART